MQTSKVGTDDHPSTPKGNNTIDNLIKQSKQRAEERKKLEQEKKEKMEKLI